MERIALVIGVNAYTTLEPLHAPAKDAGRVDIILADANFAVTVLHDDRAPIPNCEPPCGKNGMKKAINAFMDNLLAHHGRCEAFFYFSGHGDVYGNKHYLEPSDYSRPGDGIPLEVVLNAMREHATTAVAVVDACRSQYYSTKSSSSITGAASFSEPTQDSKSPLLVCWACSPWQEAIAEPDGSVYTNTLLKYISQPGLPFISAVGQASADVERLGFQQPVTEMLGRYSISWSLMGSQGLVGNEPANKEKHGLEERLRQIELEKKNLTWQVETRRREEERQVKVCEENQEALTQSAPAGQEPWQQQQVPTAQPCFLDIQYGNTHEDGGDNRHVWSFYVKPLDIEAGRWQQLIDKVIVHLHNSFNPNVRELRRTSWGFTTGNVHGWTPFEVRAVLHLQGGWSETLIWSLDFRGHGSSLTHRLMF